MGAFTYYVICRGGRGFPKDDAGWRGEEGGLWSDDVIQNRSISGFFYILKSYLNQTITQLFIVNSLYFSEITAVQVIRATEPKCCSHDNCFRKLTKSENFILFFMEGRGGEKRWRHPGGVCRGWRRGGGGLKSAKIGWRNMWTLPYCKIELKSCYLVQRPMTTITKSNDHSRFLTKILTEF